MLKVEIIDSNETIAETAPLVDVFSAAGIENTVCTGLVPVPLTGAKTMPSGRLA
jgi:hypothetical protein